MRYTDIMIKIVGNDLMRAGQKLGWIQANDIYDQEGRKLGYFTGNDIFDEAGTKIGWLVGNDLHARDGRMIRLDENRKVVSGGSYPDLVRAAIRLLLGE